MYLLPGLPQSKKVIVTAEVIDGKRPPVLLTEDGKEYDIASGSVG